MGVEAKWLGQVAQHKYKIHAALLAGTTDQKRTLSLDKPPLQFAPRPRCINFSYSLKCTFVICVMLFNNKCEFEVI